MRELRIISDRASDSTVFYQLSSDVCEFNSCEVGVEVGLAARSTHEGGEGFINKVSLKFPPVADAWKSHHVCCGDLTGTNLIASLSKRLC